MLFDATSARMVPLSRLSCKVVLVGTHLYHRLVIPHQDQVGLEASESRDGAGSHFGGEK